MTHAQPTQKRIIYVRGVNWLNMYKMTCFSNVMSLFQLPDYEILQIVAQSLLLQFSCAGKIVKLKKKVLES